MKTIDGLRSFFDSYFHIPLPIVTKHAWSSLPPRSLPIKFGTNPSTILLVIVVTDRQTDTQTNAGYFNAGENIFPRFAGISCMLFSPLSVMLLTAITFPSMTQYI